MFLSVVLLLLYDNSYILQEGYSHLIQQVTDFVRYDYKVNEVHKFHSLTEADKLDVAHFAALRIC